MKIKVLIDSRQDEGNNRNLFQETAIAVSIFIWKGERRDVRNDINKNDEP